VSARHTPFVVSGPVGCGKSMGVRALLGALGYFVMELDGVDADNRHELCLWVRRARETRTMRGRAAVVLDDFEGFTPDMRAAVVSLVAATAALPHLSPLVITCDNSRATACSGLRGLEEVRLFAPNEHHVERWFERRAAVSAGRLALLRRTHADALRNGDVRAVRLALEWVSRDGLGPILRARTEEEAAAFCNPFEATRRLLTGRVPPARWALSATTQDVALVQEHAVAHAADVDAAAELLDACSVADAMRSDRCWCSLGSVELVARATALNIRARDVGALAPRRLAPRPRMPLPDVPPGTRRTRPPSAAERRDMPAPLAG
jgi:hypothetical protein